MSPILCFSVYRTLMIDDVLFYCSLTALETKISDITILNFQ